MYADLSQSDLQWPVSVYSLTYGCFLLLSGRLADILGRRLLFLVGTAWFAAFSLGVAFAPSQVALIVLMALLGIGPAANTPAAVGLFGAHFTGRAKEKAFAILGGAQPLGYIGGLVIGGILCQSPVGWRSLFWVQAALGAIFSVMAWYCLPANHPAPHLEDEDGEDTNKVMLKRLKRIDWVGAGLSTVGLGLLTFSLAGAESAPKGWKTPYIPALLSVSILSLIGFVEWERRCEQAGRSVLVPLSIFRTPNFGPLLAVAFTAWWSFNALNYYATLFFQSVQLLSPLQTSISFLPLAISGIFLNILSGLLIHRVRPQFLILAGLVLSVAAAALFAVIKPSVTYWAMSLPFLLLLPGPDLCYSVLNLHICNGVDIHNQALAGALFNVVTRVGTSMGLAVTSAVSTAIQKMAAKRYHTSDLTGPLVLMPGYRGAAWVCFGMAILAVVISLAKLHRMEIIKHTEANENLEPRTSLAIEMDHMPSGERRERKEGSIAASSV
ncbi:putative MFS-type transporter C1683,03c OS=Schizosaccharomyces pombe (strain 972 / ATCC 24843) GN=SPBC1683.03c PE=3 SV=1 [Rhizoctonia solani AG-1 IB]|uniref:Putative MFS-type transporter C1683,03c n=1 Tax=Thanatephorus cucumeris (strain AG1-IB / isolate 7/3/14) TaxID=1108050 RepID=A0A0B7FQ39_THACB|nr:putative MFS-type transporter C1683,03c OS=Schizosaccharomyces pombe (strain 972 / ATCC 24843) GN=SPBC1683.03c PE=3 SV=1 [Rhizoctonia solani AG-1 IB]